ncbi:molybdenum cofactor biosynthesis prote [Amylocystis lapponica]|nr:molybdenum cofactor biosynthesis prote [Amylocystis lapponica]
MLRLQLPFRFRAQSLHSRALKTLAVLEQAEPLPLPQNPKSRRAKVCRLARLAVGDGYLHRGKQAKIAQIDSERPLRVSPFLVDTFSRQHNYLRISLTERCNLRCFYCMPSEGVELSPAGHILTDDEVIQLATLFVKSGVTKIRLTGGEPTVRKGLVQIVARLNELREFGLQSIGMTTNGIALERRLPSLIENGLTHLNISLDTMDPFKFEILTRRRGHEAVLRSLQAALSSSLRSVKLNVVVVKGLNDAEILDFLEMTKEKALSVRFIEFMPFTGNGWDKAKMVPSSELLARIEENHPNMTKAPDELNDTARSYMIPGYRGSFGFISSMSDHFCGSCNRLRLTADGQIKVCLFDAKEISLRDQLRKGASDAELLQTIGLAVSGKQEKHAGMEDIDVVTNRPMILIGGTRTARRDHKKTASVLRPILNHVPSMNCAYVATRHFSSSTFSNAPADQSQARLTHMDPSGRPSMVDVSTKQPTQRTATATGRIFIPKAAYELVTSALPEDVRASSPLQRARAKARSKGDVLTVAQLAAIMGCKRTAELIPLCHALPLSHIAVTLQPETHTAERGSAALEGSNEIADPEDGTPHQKRAVGAAPRTQYSIVCRAEVSCEGKTGVEMEALTAVSVGLLTVWDMLKAVAGREMEISGVYVTRKEGGKSGDFARK